MLVPCELLLDLRQNRNISSPYLTVEMFSFRCNISWTSCRETTQLIICTACFNFVGSFLENLHPLFLWPTLSTPLVWTPSTHRRAFWEPPCPNSFNFSTSSLNSKSTLLELNGCRCTKTDIVSIMHRLVTFCGAG